MSDIIDINVPYVVEHLREHAGQVKISVVSGSSRASVERTLKVLGIDRLVEICVCAGEMAFGKPHPHPFLTAASYLGVKPSDCLVLEDGQAGVDAAIAAGNGLGKDRPTG